MGWFASYAGWAWSWYGSGWEQLGPRWPWVLLAWICLSGLITRLWWDAENPVGSVLGAFIVAGMALLFLGAFGPLILVMLPLLLPYVGTITLCHAAIVIPKKLATKRVERLERKATTAAEYKRGWEQGRRELQEYLEKS